MKGDFTRFTFDPTAHYTQVRKQQGRVDLDADWNEYLDIQSYLSETTHTDVIGACGAPEVGGGFKVESVLPDGSDFNLSAGRIYVDGILCEIETPTTYLTQPDDPNPPSLSPVDGRKDLILIDVWKRHLTALEAPSIREVALGGPDTTTRVQTVWQIKVVEGVGDWTCGDDLPDSALIIPPLEKRGRLTSFADPTTPPKDICDVPTAGGYRGLENRLYRVEIHQGGDINTATFKWSRDNGAVVFAIESFDAGDPTKIKVKSLGRDQVLGLQIGDWVEVLGDTTELHGTPGTLVQITDLDEAKRELTLSGDVSAHNGEDYPKVRRWDQDSTAIPVSTTAMELEDGVKVQFADGAFQTGDYWVFAARTALADVEPLTDAAPFGIAHHYCALATLAWRAETGVDGDPTWAADLTDCRPLFPALTNLPEACDMRFHNKHLHGWGIVCGLQVYCGPDGGETRRNVTVQNGYAIDCEGYDLLIEEETGSIIDVMTQVSILEEKGTSILDDNGNGEVFLTLARKNKTVEVQVEPYDPSVNSLSGMLQNTLLMDFYNDCIKEPLELVKQLLTPPQVGNELLVSPARERFITLVNLLIQLNNPTDGRYVFLSPKEDEILRQLYMLLRGILQSKTFCAMFEEARDFPDYPFPDHQISTIFGKALYKRLRLHPNEKFGYAVGQNNLVHVFDLGSEKMIGVIDVPGGEGIVVQDVAVSPDESTLYAIATTANGENTIFVAGALDDPVKPTWQPLIVLCDLNLVTLGVISAKPELVYAIGKGQGLYELDPRALAEDPNPQPLFAFNAVGHLVIEGQKEQPIAFASANDAGGSSDFYTQIVACDLLNPAPPVFCPLRGANGQIFSGKDDITAVSTPQMEQTILVAVVDNPAGGKALLEMLANPQATGKLFPVENTEIRLGHFPGSPFVMVSFEDSYRIGLLDLLKQEMLDGYRFPVQISPMGIVPAPNTDRVYVLNVLSTTLNTIPAAYLDPSRPPETEPIPGNQEFLDKLEAYRNAIFAAFIDLLGGLLQYLKDCFCDHLLVNCPECTGKEKIYLAVVSIRNNQVYKVCNFSGRKYVKSFPTVEYWLSLFPVIPLIDKAVETICCAVLPDLFRKYTAPRENAYATAFKGADMRSGIGYVQTTNFSNFFSQATSQAKVARGLSLDTLTNFARRTVTPQTVKPAQVQQTEVAGKSATNAEKQFKAAGVEVVETKAYDPANAGNVVNFVRSASAVPAGAKVILHEQAGTVKFYEVVKETPPAISVATAPAASVSTTPGPEVTTLLATKDQEIQVLKNQVQALQTKQTALETQVTPDKIASMEAELAELRAFREEVQAFMKRS